MTVLVLFCVLLFWFVLFGFGFGSGSVWFVLNQQVQFPVHTSVNSSDKKPFKVSVDICSIRLEEH